MTEQTTPTVNVPLLRKAVEWAEAEAAVADPTKRRWQQSYFISDPRTLATKILVDREGDFPTQEQVRALAPKCGTAYCIAGWVAHELGWTDDEIEDGRLGVEVEEFAVEALGISAFYGAYGGEHLFAGGNTIADVRRIAEQIAGERL